MVLNHGNGADRANSVNLVELKSGHYIRDNCHMNVVQSGGEEVGSGIHSCTNSHTWSDHLANGIQHTNTGSVTLFSA